MRLDVLVLAAVVAFGVLYLGVAIFGLLAAVPFGAFGLIPIGLVVGLLVAVVYQRLTNKEDDYYSKNVDK